MGVVIINRKDSPCAPRPSRPGTRTAAHHTRDTSGPVRGIRTASFLQLETPNGDSVLQKWPARSLRSNSTRFSSHTSSVYAEIEPTEIGDPRAESLNSKLPKQLDVVDAAQRSVECERYPTLSSVPRGDQSIDQTRGARRFERRERGLRLETHDAG